MTDSAVFRFEISRGDDVIDGLKVTSTRETIHGLFRLEAEQLVLQWRISRTTEQVGMSIRTDREMESVRETVIPLAALQNAQLVWTWRRWPPGRYLILTAADLRAFEGIAGKDGLALKHPAELAIRVGRHSRVDAHAFAGEIELALAERALQRATDPPRLPPP